MEEKFNSLNSFKVCRRMIKLDKWNYWYVLVFEVILQILIEAPGKLELMSWSCQAQCFIYYSRRKSFSKTTKFSDHTGYVKCCLDKPSEAFIDSRPKIIESLSCFFFQKIYYLNVHPLDALNAILTSLPKTEQFCIQILQKFFLSTEILRQIPKTYKMPVWHCNSAKNNKPNLQTILL